MLNTDTADGLESDNHSVWSPGKACIIGVSPSGTVTYVPSWTHCPDFDWINWLNMVKPNFPSKRAFVPVQYEIIVFLRCSTKTMREKAREKRSDLTRIFSGVATPRGFLVSFFFIFICNKTNGANWALLRLQHSSKFVWPESGQS